MADKLFTIRIHVWWFFILFMIIAPFLFLLVGGVLWLYEHGWFLRWFMAAIGITGAGWILRAYLSHRKVSPFKINLPILHDIWKKETDPVAQKINALAETINPNEYSFNDLNKLLPLGFKVVSIVAAHFHPDENEPMLEVPLPYILKIAELICKDTRNMLNNVPMSHIITVNDIINSEKLINITMSCYTIYRIITMILYPTTAIFRETRSAIGNKVLEEPLYQLKLTLLKEYVKRVGRYAIDLYSGTLSLEDGDVESFLTKASQRDLNNLTESPVGEPLRILLLGQTNAGKSSLINALFGEMRAATDILPVTTGVERYELERDGQRLLLLDTGGYQDVANGKDYKRLETEIQKSDFIFLVCAANVAARQSDRRLLESINNCFAKNPNNPRPALLAVLSHIDQLRPLREWEPPYNFFNPERSKEISIYNAVKSVAQSLDLPVSDVIPVCLKYDAIYNIQEALIPAMFVKMDDASRVKCLRVLRDRHNAERLRLLIEQIKKSGENLLELAGRIIK